MMSNKNGSMSKGTSKRYNRKDDVDDVDDDDDDVDMSMGTTWDDAAESSGESTNEDAGPYPPRLKTTQMNRKPKLLPKRKKFNERIGTKNKNPISNPQATMKKSKFEFAYEPMDFSDEEEYERVMKESKKCRPNPRNLSKKQLTIIMAEIKRRKKAIAAKAEKKPKKTKAKATPRKRATKKRAIRNDREDERSPDNSTHEKPGNETKNKSSQHAMQKENSGGDNATSYNTDNAEKKATSVGDTRNLNNEKAAADEKKASTNAKKGPGSADINAKTSKENVKNEANKNSKAKEKVEDLSKKVDGKEVKDMDEGIATTLPNQRAIRIRRLKRRFDD